MKDITNTFVPAYDIVCDSDDDEIWVQKPPQKGDHIRVQRMNGLYAHHGIYVSDSEVIHFTGADDDSILDWDKPEVISTDLAAFLKGGTLEIKEYTDEEFADLYSPEQIVIYARACLGDKDYNLIFNNCEHFANVCTLGRFRSNQVDRFFNTIVDNSFIYRRNGIMGIWGAIKSFFGSSSSGGGSRSTTTYEPDKVKIAQIEAENKIRLSELETERIELIKQAQIEIIQNEAEAREAAEMARAKGFTVMAQTILTLQEKLNEVAQKRLEIIEIGSNPIKQEIEQIYAEFRHKIEEDNDLYMKEKAPNLLEMLNKYPENSTAHKMYAKLIDKDMSNHMEQYNIQIKNLEERQKMVLDSFLKGKEQIIGQTEALTKTMLENLSQKAQLTGADISAQLPNFAQPKQLNTDKKPALENKQ
ncbi:NC domain protein [Megamonas hypermegale]|uniref:lecithin retinol acyltransferase family protein n=1 Tax=Megamonas hypermegale TaxID=158847 RepID=UPI000B3805D3|nr:lecithin retinol acyltransferase family protein [Megamonas hypermegale]OUO41748.1 NC domain protein [Megamonas hypermegale]